MGKALARRCALHNPQPRDVGGAVGAFDAAQRLHGSLAFAGQLLAIFKDDNGQHAPG